MNDFEAALDAVSLREMPWRELRDDGAIDPYHVLVSEIMLQQTQVDRVIPKFAEFIALFPDVASLAKADLNQVLRIWNGLGYNRRAKFLYQAAQAIKEQHDGQVPMRQEQLVSLPGVGPNTAGAILAYAFNQPSLFVETNIRTVYIHHFFRDHVDVPDSAILEKLAQTLDRQYPRLFYWKLMDYGTILKREHGNLSRRSKGYAKQSSFAGSLRQLRGQVLRQLTQRSMSPTQLRQAMPDARLPDVLSALEREGLITKKKQHFVLG